MTDERSYVKLVVEADKSGDAINKLIDRCQLITVSDKLEAMSVKTDFITMEKLHGSTDSAAIHAGAIRRP